MHCRRPTFLLRRPYRGHQRRCDCYAPPLQCRTRLRPLPAWRVRSSRVATTADQTPQCARTRTPRSFPAHRPQRSAHRRTWPRSLRNHRPVPHPSPSTSLAAPTRAHRSRQTQTHTPLLLHHSRRVLPRPPIHSPRRPRSSRGGRPRSHRSRRARSRATKSSARPRPRRVSRRATRATDASGKKSPTVSKRARA
jgi:hypothetical protein